MINLSAGERKAIEEFDVATLRSAVEEARQSQSTLPLYRLHLFRLGTYVQSREHRFDRALQDYCKAKAPKNVAKKEQDAIRAGWDLVSAVEEMKERAQQEKVDGERFFVEDNIREPFVFRPDMSVTVRYRWCDEEDNWHHGQITFTHRHTPYRVYGEITSRRKKTKRQLESEQKETLAREWYHMRDLALFSVRDYFRDGGNGAEIPETFPAATDRGSLNNFSMDFGNRRTRE